MDIDNVLEAIGGIVNGADEPEGGLVEVGLETERMIDPFSMATDEEILVIEDDDGGLTIDFGGAQNLLGMQEVSFEANLAEVRDVAGAGVTFLAALAYAFTATKNIDTAIILAQDCCQKVIRKKGVTTI